MLLELRVKDLGIIEDINWKPGPGLNVITGETGAGKSLVIDAVEILLFGSAADDVIRNGAEEARIEGVFTLGGDPRFNLLKAFLTEKGLDADEELLVISCEIRKLKSGVVRINGHTVTKTVLRQTGQMLIDIHGQSQHLSLLDKKYHLDFLDSYAHTLELRNQFSLRTARLHEIETTLKSLQLKAQDTLRQEEFLKYQIDEIRKSKLHECEDEELEKERHIISFSEKLREYSQQIYQTLNENDAAYSVSVLTRVNEALRMMKKLVDLDPALKPQLDYLEKTLYGLEEIARDVQDYGDKINNDPKRLEEIESRLELIGNLKRKYGKTIGDILIFQEKAERELTGIGLTSEKQAKLESELAALKKEMGQIATEISEKRQLASQHLITEVKKELQDLEMSQMQFDVAITRNQSPEGISGTDGCLYAFSNDGCDDIEFMVSTNPGESLKPLSKIASTGEISRFTLALKGALSETDNIPILIFDEIDIGVGGRSGDILGRKLWKLSQNHQVICVTHLPQIAAYADAHFGVRKEVNNSRTTSTLENFNHQLRLKELALMLAGPDYSETALKNSAELMQRAEKWKKPVDQPPSIPTQLKF